MNFYGIRDLKNLIRKKVNINKRLKDKFWKALNLFVKNSFDHNLRTHKLTGKLEGYWAFSIDYDCRVIFKFLKEDKILLMDIGSHDEVY